MQKLRIRSLSLLSFFTALFSAACVGVTDGEEGTPSSGNYYYYADDYDYNVESPTDKQDVSTDPIQSPPQTTTNETETTPESCDSQAARTVTIYPNKADTTAGASLARAYIEQGVSIDFNIRESEFTNYYKMNRWASNMTSPTPVLGISPVITTGGNASFNLLTAVAMPDIPEDEHEAVNLTIVIDNSESMAGSALALAKKNQCVNCFSTQRYGHAVHRGAVRNRPSQYRWAADGLRRRERSRIDGNRSGRTGYGR